MFVPTVSWNVLSSVAGGSCRGKGKSVGEIHHSDHPHNWKRSQTTLSQSKSTVAASHPRLLRAVQRELLEQGMSFESANSVRDVGLDETAAEEICSNPKEKRAEM